MPGSKPKYPIQLFNNEISELRQLVRSRKVLHDQVMRARTILTAHEHLTWSNQEVARYIGCSDRVVRTWRRGWSDARKITPLGCCGDPSRIDVDGARKEDASITQAVSDLIADFLGGHYVGLWTS
jgi:uncharacterized protein YPO0396